MTPVMDDMLLNFTILPPIWRKYNSTFLPDRQETCHYHCSSFERFSDLYDPLHKPLTLLICIFGVGTNGINLIVLTRPGMINIMNILLTGLSAAQFCLLVNYLSLILYNYLAENCLVISMLSSYNWACYKWVNVNLNVSFHATALLHTLFLALFRFMAVKAPHLALSHLNFTVARRVVLALHFLTPLLCCPTFLTTFVGKIVLSKREQCCGLREYYDLVYVAGEEFFQSTLWIYGVFFKLIPSLTISLLSFYLIRSLKHVDIRHNRLTRKENVKRKVYRLKLTKMFIVVTLLCVAVELPHGILNMLTGVFGKQFGTEVYDNLGDFFEMLTLLYSSVNFVLYCLMNTGYQRTLKHIMQTILARLTCKKYEAREENLLENGEEVKELKCCLVDQKTKTSAINGRTAIDMETIL